MNPRECILLSPYRLPAQHALTLADEDMAAWLHSYSALWHPAALWQATAPPRVESAYDHEKPRPGCVYAMPASPPSLLPDDWHVQAAAAGAAIFRSGPDRPATLANLLAALNQPESTAKTDNDDLTRLANLSDEVVAPFLALGLGYLLLATLSEAMEHENLLHSNEFWMDVQCAIAASADLPPPFATPPETTDPTSAGWPPYLRHLQSAATRLLAARETLYPVAIHLLDIAVLDGDRMENPWPASWKYGQPINVIASASALEKLQRGHGDHLAALQERLQADKAEVCGGDYLQREDAVLPLESQWWNLRKGTALTKEILGADVKVFARTRFGAHPQLPTWLNQFGITRALLLPSAEPGMPAYNSPVVSWSTPDGRQLECFVRKPLATDSVDAFFNLGHWLFKTTREDHTATLAFLHGKNAALPWFGDLLELARFGPVTGRWTTFSRFFSDGSAGEYVGPLVPDDFHFDYLSERTPQEAAGEQATPVCIHPTAIPVSGFASHLRRRRRLDSCWTVAALYRGLTGRSELAAQERLLEEVEAKIETAAASNPPAETAAQLSQLENQIAGALAERLQTRAPEKQPGYLLLNPCAFTRRVALELDAVGLPPRVVDPVKACQKDGNKLYVVAEIPPLGFAWIPQAGPPGSPASPIRMRLADERCVRNEFFEAEIDPATGGLRAIRDHKTLLNRIAQRLVFRPGSTMKATRVTTTSTGPALGEIVTEGTLNGAQGQVLAKFRQRFRAWLGRPILDLRIELYPEQPPAGYGWHAYYGAQFAWRDERTLLLRGVNGMGYVTTHLRPQTPDYLELRVARHNTVLFPGGLPFHQREGGRMLEIILVPPGETAQVFDLAIGLDREQPMQTALGLASPTLIVPTTKGPPHIGAKGWLFQLDAPNIALTSLRPSSVPDALIARVLECSGISTPAELRCVRDPFRVTLVDGKGQVVSDGSSSGDAVHFNAGPGELLQLQIQFSRTEVDRVTG
jgi:hypothetical protein